YICFNPYSGAEEAYSPHESSADYADDNSDKRQADLVKKKVEVKSADRPGGVSDRSLVYAVDNRTVNLRHKKLQIVDSYQRENAQQQYRRVFYVIFVDILSENHVAQSFYICYI